MKLPLHIDLHRTKRATDDYDQVQLEEINHACFAMNNRLGTNIEQCLNTTSSSGVRDNTDSHARVMDAN